jgi:diguanylate cyclase (GGDEF)-like protein
VPTRIVRPSLLIALAVTVTASAVRIADAPSQAAGQPYVPAAIVVALGALFALAGFVVFVRPARRENRRRAEEERYRSTQTEFTDLLQLTRGEAAAQDLLRRHVERTIPGCSVVVLNRNNSRDRLEAVTALPDAGRLGERLITATPASCLAVRLARPHTERPGGDALMPCELCGRRPTASRCLPLLVGGEVIGSVLVDHEGELGAEESRRLGDSIRQAGPVLANLRHLAIAERRAATDPLTGLPNRRAFQDTMKRMLAHARRTAEPLSVLTIDLDHFKHVNDAYGHEHGDAVLAGVGDVLESAVRASDFVARYGGEEFVVLAPDTDASGAAVIAEKLRRAIGAISLPADGGPITGSLGVAVFPEHGADAEMLLRAADRALYAAKERGRNRVQMAAVAAKAQGLVEAPAPP